MLFKNIGQLAVSYLQSLSDFLELANLKTVAIKVTALLTAFLAPIDHLIIGLLMLVAADLITGLFAAKKRGEKITSSKLSRTISKIGVYVTTLIVIHIMDYCLLWGSPFEVTSVVAAFIAITELKSILENLNCISDQNLLDCIIKRLSNERFKTPIEQDKKKVVKKIAKKGRK